MMQVAKVDYIKETNGRYTIKVDGIVVGLIFRDGSWWKVNIDNLYGRQHSTAHNSLRDCKIEINYLVEERSR